LMRLELFQRFQSLLWLAEIALCDGLDVKRLGIGRTVEQLSFYEFKGFLELTALQ